jgi:dihydrofolate reductase
VSLPPWSGRPAAFSSVSLVLDAHDGARREHALNDAPKYVASDTAEPRAWPNSTFLSGDVPKAVVELEGEPGGDLHIMRSGVLIQSLMPHSLIDEFVLMIHPLVLGSGRELFQDGSPQTPLRLVDSVITTKGVVITTYQPVGTV